MRVSPQAPLYVADIKDTGSAYGIVLYDGSLFIGKVIAIYAKTTGKNARRSSFTEASSITGVTYLDVQVFEEKVGQQFTSFIRASSLQNKRFAHLHSDFFLCTLESKPVVMENGLKVSREDHARFQSMKKAKASVVQAVKKLRGKKRDDEPDDDD